MHHNLFQWMPETLGESLRFWRKASGLSQMHLALKAGISSRHLSFIETGRSTASEALILTLAHNLKLNFRQTNRLLLQAGYPPAFNETPLDDQAMSLINSLLHQMLTQHLPYPAFVISCDYRLLIWNSAYAQLVHFYAGENALKTEQNVMRLLFAENGLTRISHKGAFT
ncbi:MAG: helix-turn-helix domain-containing protein [Candidatus Sericytochromatia bacterium]|nr:helix-turn-helix domain-containing protein [Candidatus Sericytochromatia bacterium]